MYHEIGNESALQQPDLMCKIRYILLFNFYHTLSIWQLKGKNDAVFATLTEQFEFNLKHQLKNYFSFFPLTTGKRRRLWPNKCNKLLLVLTSSTKPYKLQY